MFKAIKNMFTRTKEEESESIEVLESTEEDEKEYSRESIIELEIEEVDQIIAGVATINSIKKSIGDMRFQYLTAEASYLAKIKQINTDMERVLGDLRTTYNVDPAIDYELGFPEEEGGQPFFKRI